MCQTKLIFLVLIQIILAREVPAAKEIVQPRIFGGSEATLQQVHGFAVQLYNNNRFHCSGSLLTERHVLTSAHCFENSYFGNFHVVAGSTQQINYFYENDKNKLSSIRIHPDFDKWAYRADIAVARVRRPIRGPNIGYARLCSVRLFAGDWVTAAGWGISEYAQQYNPLRSIRVPIVSKQECDRKMNRVMPDNVLCATGYNKLTICNGDSGGPVIHNGEVCGLNTWTWICGNNQYPDIIMSVYYYRKFITDSIRELGF